MLDIFDLTGPGKTRLQLALQIMASCLPPSEPELLCKKCVQLSILLHNANFTMIKEWKEVKKQKKSKIIDLTDNSSPTAGPQLCSLMQHSFNLHPISMKTYPN